MFTKSEFDEPRRRFLKQGLAGIAAITGWKLLPGCKPQDRLAHIKGSIVGANHETGHLLRHPERIPKPTATMETEVLIIGGGIAGLSAKRWLVKHSNKQVLLLEMDTSVGGNSRYGENKISAYPFGAHYLPIPDLRNIELLDFLQETGSVEGFNAAGLPVYNEYHLCQDPEERLFINGYWQEGLVPDAGVSPEEKAQIKRFFEEMDQWKQRRGTDGLDAFTIPVSKASRDAAFEALHSLPFATYLKQAGYTSPYLLWYLNYGCKDDYGADLHNTSAWAGIHYFAARKGKAANAPPSGVLTWPAGNGFLMKHLKSQCRGGLQSSWLVYEVRQQASGVVAFCYDVAAQKSIAVTAGKVIMATPVHVNKRLLQREPAYQALSVNAFKHAPWLIANLTVTGLPQGKGMPLCWDNVLYNTPSVGYVNANHQDLGDSSTKVITLYWPFTETEPDAARSQLHNRTYRQLLGQVVAELERAHPDMGAYITRADLWIWGHGMIAPAPGFMNSEARKIASSPISNRIFFAHTDLSGISIFEEAFYQGIEAAKQVISVS